MSAIAGTSTALVQTELADCELCASKNIAVHIVFANIRRNGRPAVRYRTRTGEATGRTVYLN